MCGAESGHYSGLMAAGVTAARTSPASAAVTREFLLPRVGGWHATEAASLELYQATLCHRSAQGRQLTPAHLIACRQLLLRGISMRPEVNDLASDSFRETAATLSASKSPRDSEQLELDGRAVPDRYARNSYKLPQRNTSDKAVGESPRSGTIL
jgi:hypothetical protein